ncbi:hypothetical protein DFH07DRAFT_334465 [Mycena maculata]|uniref:VASt domain-containing protein n=1 Tax=Mycena maculata TaxID=230809 RepID=A0AAD7HDV1_9AGAR|nr:hypothetical protein DFH07DRAFT_334465 [Mycena maculata]
MAPNFLSKLVKPSAGTRDRSLSSPSPPSPVSRSRTPSSVDHSISSRNPSALSSNSNTYSNGTTNTKSNGMYSATNPSVTVIPPSPVVNNAAVPDLPTYRPTTNGNGLPHTGDSSTAHSEESVTPTPDRPPVPAKPVPAAPAAVARPPTPKKSERTPTSSPQMSTSSLPRKASNKSLKQLQPQEHTPTAPPVPPMPATAPARHSRAATSPASSSGHAVEEDDPEPSPLSDSPVALRPTEFPQTSPSSSYTSGPSPSRRDTDAFSITSQGERKKKPTSRPWRRSAPKKPMGLAGAIAASGLAMANPAMTSPQHSTLGPQVMNTNENRSSPSLVTSPTLNPRKLNQSPDAVSTHHRRHHTASNGKPQREKTEHLRRRTTGSAASHGEGDGYFPDEQAEYYSGLDDSPEDGSGSDSEGESGSGLEDLDLGEDDIPVTGFAVASNKRNADFHELFPGIPEGDYLIDDYGCALQREILIQGRIYVSENHLCFHANIFGWVTDLLIPIYEITTLEKKMTAFVIPNAIRIGTPRADYTFASFLSRDTTFDVIHNIWRLARPSDAASIGSGSLEGAGGHVVEGTIIGGALLIGGVVQRNATQCACGKQGSHFSETAMETIVPGTPDRIYNLMFASGFMKDFMAVNQKLLDIQVADWAPIETGSKLLARNMSYIKPLNASLGPKQTKCEIRDETVHLDFDDYVSTVTTTRNPDVPSGGVFSVKTRTCIMWATPLSTKVIVTTQVEWTGRSFIKGIIERSAIEGQKEYHVALEQAMRVYIKEHQSEFMPAGVDPTAIVIPDPVAGVPPMSPGLGGDALSEKEREKERSRRGLQWAWDTFDGAAQVAKRSTKGALELIRDGWENSTATTILYFLIVVLVFSNVWTYMRMGSAVDKGRKKDMELAKVGDKEQWVAGVVTALFDELNAGKLTVTPPGGAEVGPRAAPAAPVAPLDPENLKLEISSLQMTLDRVEERVRSIRGSLGEIESLNNVD